ncbi:MAG TPA: MFS transporter, partial [Actinomycetota bacterium]|nr:MFS transporter [Actinomycetota bacterium]
VAAIGFGVYIQLDGDSSFTEILIGSTLFSLGTAPLFTLTNDLIIGSAPPERAGAAAGLSETSAELGGALGIALFGSIGVAVYRGAMADAVPSEVPLRAADAARDTLGGALGIAADLPGDVGAAIIATAQDAFLQGVHVVALISVVGSLALAAFVMALLQRARPGTETYVHPTEDTAPPSTSATARPAEPVPAE